MEYLSQLFGSYWPDIELTVWTLMKIVAIVGPLMIAVAYLTYAERKVIGFMQVRMGPNRVGYFGLLQPMADGIKLLMKEIVLPTASNKGLFLLGPVLAIAPAFAAWAVIPFDATLVLADIDAGLLYVLAMTSIAVYGVIIAGWASNSKYAFLGSLRSAAQIVSYEIAMGFCLVGVLMCANSLNLGKIVLGQEGGILHWYFLPLFPLFIVYFISAVAETNRAPFDVADLAALMFLGGWLSPVAFLPDGIWWLFIKMAFLVFFFLWFRATFPRYRYDQIMRLGWKVFIPITIVWIVVVGGMMQTDYAHWFH